MKFAPWNYLGSLEVILTRYLPIGRGLVIEVFFGSNKPTKSHQKQNLRRDTTFKFESDYSKINQLKKLQLIKQNHGSNKSRGSAIKRRFP